MQILISYYILIKTFFDFAIINGSDLYAQSFKDKIIV